MTDNDILIRRLDDAFGEFDRLMERALAEIRGHAALERDWHTLCTRHQAARAAGAGFVYEAAAAFADLRTSDRAA